MTTAVTDDTAPRARPTPAPLALLPEVLLLPLLAVLVAAPALLRGELIGRGEIAHEYSMYAFVARSFRAGHLPLWNPYTVSGSPGLADPVANTFYPLTALLLTFTSVSTALNTMILLHTVLAGALMHWYLGVLGRSRPGRLVGAIVYMLSGFVAWRILSGDIPRLATYAWIPLLFGLVDEIAAGRRGAGAALLGGLVLAWQFFAGDPQTFTYAALAMAAYACFRVASEPSGPASTPNPRRAAGLVVLLFVIGAGVACPQALPTLEEFSQSNRAGFGAAFTTLGSVPPIGLVSLVAPRFFGDEIHGWWGEGELQAPEFYPHAASFYTGFFTIVLAITALLGGRPRWHVWFFAGLAVAVLWTALGTFGYIYRAVAYVPLLRSFRDIENVNVLLPLCTSVLAAIGFDRFLEEGDRPEFWSRVLRHVAFAVGAAIVIVGVTLLAEHESGLELLSLPVVRRALAESVVFLVLAWAGSAYLIRTRARHDAAPWWLAAAAVAFLAADLLYSAAPMAAAGTDPRTLVAPDAITRYLAQDHTVFRVSGFYDRGPMFAIQDVDGEPSLLLARYQEYTDVLQGRDPDRAVRPEGPHGVFVRTGLDSPLLALLNVKYSILPGGALRGRRSRDPSRPVQVATDFFIYKNPQAAPRVFATPNYRVRSGRAAILRELTRPGYDPADFVVLEQQPALPPEFTASAAGQDAGANIRVASYEDAQVVLRGRFPRPAFVVLNDMYYPEWRAEVDGRPAPIYRANYLFRAVAVPAGRHEIRFAYRDRMLWLGTAIALLTLAGGVAVFLTERPRPGARRRRLPAARNA